MKRNRLLKISEASKILNVHPNTLRKWDKKGILNAVRFGERKDRRYKKEDILKLLHKRE
jgi:excisionase family DNA binding protein